MGTYYLSDRDRWRFEMRARWSALSEPALPDHLRLFNRNDGTTLQVRIVSQVLNRAEWIVECESVPAHFAAVLRPVAPADHMTVTQ